MPRVGLQHALSELGVEIQHDSEPALAAGADAVRPPVIPFAAARPSSPTRQSDAEGVASASGEKVPEGSSVELMVSSGDPVQVPVVIGLELEKALEALSALGFTVEVELEARSGINEVWIVIAQSRSAGTALAAGETVSIAVSKGTELVAVPDVEGLTLTSAVSSISKVGLFIDGDPVVDEASEQIEKGSVIGTVPAAGELVAVGEFVTIVVSGGAPIVHVRNVAGLFADTAVASLSDQHLVPVLELREVPTGDPRVGRVIEQAPAAFTEVEPGTEVVIVIGQAGG